MGNLTKAQLMALRKAAQPGGVVGFGQKWKVVKPLQNAGLIKPNSENYGYFVATKAGRAALSQESDR